MKKSLSQRSSHLWYLESNREAQANVQGAVATGHQVRQCKA